MFEAIKFPARVPDLATGLTNVDGDALTLVKKELYIVSKAKKILKLCKMSSFYIADISKYSKYPGLLPFLLERRSLGQESAG